MIIKQITMFFQKYLLKITGADNFEARIATASVASFIAGAKAIILQYVWADPTFIVGLIIIMAIDTITGIWKARKMKIFKSRVLGRQTMIKIITYFFTLVVLKQLDNFLARTWAVSISQYFVDTACAMMIIAEVVSVLENLAFLNPKSPFAPLVRTLNRFLKSGSVADLTIKQAPEEPVTPPVEEKPAETKKTE